MKVPAEVTPIAYSPETNEPPESPTRSQTFVAKLSTSWGWVAVGRCRDVLLDRAALPAGAGAGVADRLAVDGGGRGKDGNLPAVLDALARRAARVARARAAELGWTTGSPSSTATRRATSPAPRRASPRASGRPGSAAAYPARSGSCGTA